MAQLYVVFHSLVQL